MGRRGDGTEVVSAVFSPFISLYLDVLDYVPAQVGGADYEFHFNIA